MGTFPSVCVGGSRSLSSVGLALVAGAVSRLLALGFGVVTGCAVGADLAAVNSAITCGFPGRLSVFCAGSESGFGWPSRLVPPGPALASRSGARVFWWLSSVSVPPFRARLALRARACVSASASGVWFVAPPPAGHGSLVAASFAASLGHSVWVVPVGFSASALPALAGCAGSWAPASPGVASLLGVPAVAWSPAVRQPALF